MKTIIAKSGETCTVDDDAFDGLSKNQWLFTLPHGFYRYDKSLAISGTYRISQIYMHREIMGAMRGQTVLRKDDSIFNNCKDNLYFFVPTPKPTPKLIRNPLRRSKYKGVRWNTKRTKWESYNTMTGSTLRRYVDEDRAAEDYDDFQIRILGELGDLNFDISNYSYLLDPEIPDGKPCIVCNQIKPIRNFNWHPQTNDKHVGICKSCEKIRREPARKARISEVKERIIELKHVPCSDCHVQYAHYIMQFHHIDPTEKELPIPQCKTIAQLLREADKCVILCANCHLEREWGKDGLSRNRSDKLSVKVKQYD